MPSRQITGASVGNRKTRRSAPGRIAGRLLLMLMLVVVGGFLVNLRAWPPIKVVMSSSMEPAIDTGDVVLMQGFGGSPRVGDVVSIHVPAEAQERFGYPQEVLHRVIEITEDGLVRTKGDNLDEPDPFGVPVASVNTRAFTVIPGAGRAIAFLASPYGLVWLAAGVLLFLVMPFFGSHRELVVAVEEYGYHLRSHTEILKSMSVASQELAATVVQLRGAMEMPPRQHTGQVSNRRVAPIGPSSPSDLRDEHDPHSPWSMQESQLSESGPPEERRARDH